MIKIYGEAQEKYGILRSVHSNMQFLLQNLLGSRTVPPRGVVSGVNRLTGQMSGAKKVNDARERSSCWSQYMLFCPQCTRCNHDAYQLRNPSLL